MLRDRSTPWCAATSATPAAKSWINGGSPTKGFLSGVEVAAQDLADYEKILLDEILAVPAVLTAHSVFAIRTVLSRGPVPLTHWH